MKAKSIQTAAKATKKTLAESDEVLKAVNKEFIFNPDISDAKEMAKNIYGSDFKKANLLQKEALVRQTDNDIMKYLKVLEGTREAPKGMKLPPQNKINDLVDNILTQLEDPTTGTKKGFRFSQGTLRNYKYSIVDALLNTKKGTFETRRKKLVEGAGKELDEIFSLGATHRMAPGYAEAVQTIPIKANRAKKELDLKMQRLLSALNEGKTTMQWNNIKNVPIKEAVKDFNKSSLKFANQYKVKAPKINISGTLSKDFLANFGPESKKNIQDVFKNKNYFLSEVKNRPVDTLTSKTSSLLKTAKNVKGSAKVKAVASVIAILGSGKLADEVLKKHGISLTQDENEKVLEASMLPTELIQEHPVTSALGAAATLRGSKSVPSDPLKKVRRLHRYVSTPLKKLIKSAGTPLAGAGFAGWQIHDNLKSGESVADAVVDPIVGAELAFPSLFKENLSKIIPDKYKGKLAKAGRKVLGLGKVGSRFMGPVGIGIGAVGSVYDAYKDYERRKPDIEKVKELRKQGVIKEEKFDENLPMFKSGGNVEYDDSLPDIFEEDK